MHHSHLQTQAIKLEEYTIKIAKIIAQTIMMMNDQLVQTFSLNKGIKEFGTKSYKAAHEKMKQFLNCTVIKAILI